MNWVKVQWTALLLVNLLSEYCGLIFRGIKQETDSGLPYLKFMCSSENNSPIHYVEFLSNKESTASLVFYEDTGKCDYRHELTNCGDLCTCYSNGTYYSWTFPMPITPTVYACLMYTNNQNIPEESYIIYNGEGFDNGNGHSDVSVSSTKGWNMHTRRGVTEPPPPFSNSGVIAIVLVSSGLVLALFVVVWIVLRGKIKKKRQKRKSNREVLREDDLSKENSEIKDKTANMPLLGVIDELSEQEAKADTHATSEGSKNRKDRDTDSVEQEMGDEVCTDRRRSKRTRVRKRYTL